MDAIYPLRPFLTLGLRAGREPRLYRTLFGRPTTGRPPAITVCLDRRPPPQAASRERIEITGTHQRIPWRAAIDRDPAVGRQVRFASPIFRPYLAFHIAVLPLLREELNRLQETLVIGAAFGHHGQATVLLGRTGVGKTRTMLRAVEHGALPIADEYFSASADGAAHPLLRVVGLRENVRRQAPGLYRALPRRLKLALAALRLTGLVMHPPLLLHATWADVGLCAPAGESWKIARVWWIDPTRGQPVERLTPAEMARRAVTHLAAHDRWYRPPDAPISLADGALVRELLTHAFSGATCQTGPPEAVPIDPEQSPTLREHVG